MRKTGTAQLISLRHSTCSSKQLCLAVHRIRYKVFAKGCPVSRGRILICDMSKLVSEIFLVLDRYSFANFLVGYVNKFLLVSGLMGWFVA